MDPVIYYTANSGIYIWNGSHGLMIDYLFDGGDGWSSMLPACLDRMRGRQGEYEKPHTLLFTHRHSDHFSEELLLEHSRLYTSDAYCLVDLPECGCITGCPGYDICYIRGKHQGSGLLGKTPAAVVAVRTKNSWIVHLSDVMLTEELIVKLGQTGIRAVDGLFINLYHLTERSELLHKLDPGSIFCIHRPLPEDDIYGFDRQVRKTLERLDPWFGRRVMLPEAGSRIFLRQAGL